MEKVTIAFIGEDKKYYSEVKDRLKENYPSLDLEFLDFELNDQEGLLKTLHKLINLEIHLFYIDIALKVDLYLKLAKLIRDQSTTRNIPVIGLIGGENETDHYHRGVISGMEIIYVKSGEICNLVFHGIRLTKPDFFTHPQVAVASFTQDKVEAKHFFRIGFMTNKYIHVESGVDFEIGDQIEVHHNLVPKENYCFFKVVRLFDYNLYYNFKQSFDFEFQLDHKKTKALINTAINENKEKAIPEEIDFEKVIKDKVNKKRKEAIEAWIQENQEINQPKRTKVLVFDREMITLQQAKKSLDSFPFSLRPHKYLDKNLNIIKEVYANIIIINLDNHGPKEREKEVIIPNSLETVNKLIKSIKEFRNYRPFIFLCNCPNSEELEEVKKQYSGLLSWSESYSFDLLLKIQKIYEEKEGRSVTINPDASFGKKENRLYFNKQSEESLASFSLEVRFIRASENSIFFVCNRILHEHMVLFVEHPTELCLTVLPFDEESMDHEENLEDGQHIYEGLVHGIHEIGIQKLRQYVNENFLPPYYVNVV